MVYTVYIPNSNETYSRKDFVTVKELARWAMEAALEDTPTPTYATVEPSAPALVVTEDMNPLLHCFKTYGMEDYADLYEEAIQKEDWKTLANKFVNSVFKKCFKPSYMLVDSEESTMVRDFMMFVVRNTECCMPEIDAKNPVPWWKAPKEFNDACEEIIEKVCRPMYPLASTSLFYEYYKQLYIFFTKKTPYSCWFNVFPNTFDILSTAAELTEHFMVRWLQGEKPTDLVRIFFTRHFIARSLRKEVGSTIGAAEFYDMVSSSAQRTLNIPDKFCKWVFGGITFIQLRTAMEEMGIAQVRRASGQQYIDVGNRNDLTGMNYGGYFTTPVSCVIDQNEPQYACAMFELTTPTEQMKKEFFMTLKANNATLAQHAEDLLKETVETTQITNP